MRIESHPILEFRRGEKVKFYYEGKEVEAYEGETIAAALYANGIYDYSESIKNHKPRGIFCAIGHCSSCLMNVDGIPNVRICVTEAKENMRVTKQYSKGDLYERI